jgi:hypothetical protein
VLYPARLPVIESHQRGVHKAGDHGTSTVPMPARLC